MTEKQESKMMSRVVESLDRLVKRNFEIKEGMQHGLSRIYPRHIETPRIEDPMCDEDPRDYCYKISILIAVLEEITNGHERNLIHLNEIV